MERRAFVLGLGPAVLALVGARRVAGQGSAATTPVAGQGADGMQERGAPDSSAGTLYDPYRAGQPIAPRGERDNAAAIKAIEQRLKCTCGCNLDVYTCRTTDFTCSVSPAMHRQVMGMWGQGKTAEEIIAAFVSEHGEAILMAPPKEGFNLVGYFMPFAALLVGLTGLLMFLRRHARRAAAVAAAEGGADGGESAADATPDELEQLERELAEFEG